MKEKENGLEKWEIEGFGTILPWRERLRKYSNYIKRYWEVEKITFKIDDIHNDFSPSAWSEVFIRCRKYSHNQCIYFWNYCPLADERNFVHEIRKD